jgi:hypothetical protein
MAEPSAAATMLDREFLTIRSRLLDVAAALDRIDRADGADRSDARRGQIEQALAIVAGGSPDRAERVQMHFSLPYDAAWRKAYDV